MRFNLLLLFTFLFQLVFSQTTENTVTLTTSGTGKTLEEAKNNALRSAIEQAFGAFISSKTEILNDEIVKDEIISVSSGSITKFEILSETKTTENNFALTLKAEVSVSGLTSYCENKGIQIEFKGALFSTNLKIQELNEGAELKSIYNLITTSSEILKKSIDYEVKISDPKLETSSSELYLVKYAVECKPNSNLYLFQKYLLETLLGISMSESEKNEYVKLNKPVYSFVVSWVIPETNSVQSKKNKKSFEGQSGYKHVYFRNIESIIALQNFLIFGNYFFLNFQIVNDLETLTPFPFSKEKSLYRNSQVAHKPNFSGWILNANDVEVLNSLNQHVNDDKIGLIDFRYKKGLGHTSWGYFFNYIQDNLATEQLQKLNFTVSYRPRLGDRYIFPSREINLYKSEGVDLYGLGILSLTPMVSKTHLYFGYYTKEQLGKMTFVKVEPLK